MKFNFKYFIIGLIVILGISYIIFFSTFKSNDDTKSSYTTVTVETGDIKESIEVVGEAQLVDEQSMSFNTAGTITKVNYKAGDTVKEGSVIAEIDNTDALNSIEDAKINLENANISMQQLYEGADESQILQAKNSITTAENNLIIAKKEFENLKVSQGNSLNEMLENIETSKKELETSKSSLELAKSELETTIKEKTNTLGNSKSDKSTTVQNIEDNFKTYLVEIEKIIEEADKIMGVTSENETKNDDYENFLGVKNSSYKNDAESLLLESISLYKKIKIDLGNYDYSGDKDKIKSLLTEYLTIFNKLYETTDMIYKTVDNSIASVGSLSDSEIDSMKSTMSSYRSSSLSKVSSINSSINTLETLTDIDLLSETNKNSITSKQESIKSQELNIEKQELSIKNAEKNYEETLSSYEVNLESKEKDLDSKEISLEIAKLNLEELLEGPTDENVRKAKNSIKQAEIKLETAYESLGDYQLIAPFDGVVRKIDYMVGDNLTNDTDKYVYIENPNLLEITVMLDQVDIINVKEGTKANIIFDAYTDIPVEAKISNIDTTPVQSSGVVSYEVKLVLDSKNFDKKILSGMSADVEIITKSFTGTLLVKTTAITEKNGKNYVTLLDDNKQIETEIVIGIASNGKTQVLSGLENGDIVVIQNYVSTTEEKETTTSLFGPGNRSNSSNRTSGNTQGPPSGF